MGMTIDETIEYLEKTARNQLECAEKIDELGCDSTSIRSMADYYNRLAEWLRELKDYKDARVGCEYCKHKFREQHERPCSLCQRNFIDKFEREVNADG